MKKTKKLASWILALTMVAGIVPAMAEENTNGEAPVVTKESTTSLLFAEDFEGYEVGVVAENPVDATTVKNYENEAFNLTLHPGDKLEIAEENGNKYMKLTVGNTTTSETKILYNFPESYVGGEKRVSYDFYPEVHSRRFNFLGVVNDSIKSTRAQMMCTYGNAIYLSNGVGGSVPGIFGFLDVNKYSGEFGTITQTLTLDGATKTSSVRARSVGQKEEKTGNCLASTAVSFMEWSAIKHSIAAYNGSVKAEDGSDVAGVYRIDNITVEDVKKLGGDVTKITEDFEGYPEGKLYEKVANATFTVQNGDSIEIAKDPVTGSKGIKITKSDKSTEITKVVFDYGEVADDVVKISYDVRFQNHSKLLQGFPMLSTGATWINYRNNIYWSGTMNANTTFANWLNVAGDTNVQHIEFIHDPKAASNNTTVALIKSNGAVYTGSYNVGAGQAFKTVTFNTDYATASEGASAHMGQSTGDGVYWIDNITVEIMQLRLENSSIKDGETAVSVKKDLILNFNEAVSETIKELIVVKKGAESLVYGEDYTVTLSDDSKTVTIDAVGGKWEYETNYEVVIPETDGLTNMKPYSGTKINFVTGKFSSVLVDDNFSYLTVGDRWEVPADETEGKTVAIGENISVKMQPGDSVEYAYDEVRGQYGLKLIKGITAGEMDFLYNFPEKYENGKYRVTVDERIAHHSKAHPYWPALLDGSGAVIETGFYGSGYWIGRTGNFGVDRFGVDWSAVNASRFIEGYGENNSVVGEIITGIGCRIGTHNPETDIYQWSKEPAITKTSLGGIRMKMNWTGSSSANWSTMYVPGSAKETEENPNNDGIAWIYSVKVEEIRLDVIETSFEKSQLEFSPSEPLTITFNESLDLSTVNADTFKLYKGDELIDSYEYNVSLSENGKTVTLSPVAGLEYGTEYTIKITKNVKPTEKVIDGLWDEKIYTIKVEEYENKSNPDIVWSSIPNGSQNVDYNIDSIILSTDDVLLDAATVTKDNIKVYENGVAIDTYQVSVEEKFAVKVIFDGLKKDANYKITVTGLKSDGKNILEMIWNYELNFITRDDIYLENIVVNIGEDEQMSSITAELFNKSTEDVSYQPIVAVKNKNDKNLVDVKIAKSGTVLAGGSVSLSIPEIEANFDNFDYELYVWKSLSDMNPIVKKKTVKNATLGKTIIFAEGGRGVLNNGNVVDEKISIYQDGNGFVIPAELASKYIISTDTDLSEKDIKSLGVDVYVSDEFGFIAIGDDVDFDKQSEVETIKKFGIYVSPDGDDKNPGYSSLPVKTLERAVAIYEEDNKQPIFVHAGKYGVFETIELSSEDEGMTITDFGDGEVIVSGAIELPASEFVAVTDKNVLNKIPQNARGNVKKISLDKYIEGTMARYPEYIIQSSQTAYYELFSGDEAQKIARWPNNDFSTISNADGDSFEVTANKAELWKNADDGMIASYFYYDWAFENIYIDKDNSSGSKIVLTKEHKYGIKNGQRFYAMNMLEELDVPGEYYIDNAEKILYYYPTDNFSITNPELSVMSKSFISMSDVSGIKISGIIFEKNRDRGINVKNSENISIDRCILRNIGNVAVKMSADNSEIINSHMYSIGGSCIVATAGSKENLQEGNIRIADNVLHNFGRIFRTYQGAVHLNGCGNIAEYNTIYDAPHVAIMFTGSKHKIQHNEIYNVVNECSDSGAIYNARNWTDWGTEISYNYLHDIVKNIDAGKSVVAIYMDDLLSGAIVENNVIKNCHVAALFGGGRGNIFRNNIVVDCEKGIVYDNRGETYSNAIVKPDDKTSDNVYEEFVDFIKKSGVIDTMDERITNFNGFRGLVDDVNESIEKGSYEEMAYPKDAIITGNKFYGRKVYNSEYISVENSVKTWGNYSDNTKSLITFSYSLPDCGARNMK